MSYYGSSDEHAPVTYLRGHPIYAAHFIVLVFVASMLVTTMLMFANSGSVADWMIFDSTLVLHGQAWRIFTYGFWNPPGLLFAIDMLMLVWFGREVEKVLGRAKFLTLYGCVYLLTPVLFTALGPWLPMSLGGESGAFAIFIAFATLYPNVPILFMLLAKWVAAILVGIYSLMGLASHSWSTLLSLWATTGFAFIFIRFHQGVIELPKLRLPRRKPKLRVLPDLPKARPARPAPLSAPMAEIDALLDKIAQSGIGSLTPKERAKLDAARRDLKKRSDA
jgi:membrane associated rhomboid family serine protease